MIRLAVTAGLAATTLAACATTDSSPPRQSYEDRRVCFSVNNVAAFNYVDDSTVRIRTADSMLFDIHLHGVCPQLQSAVDMAFVSNSGSSICTGEPDPGSIQTASMSCDISNATVHIPDYIRR